MKKQKRTWSHNSFLPIILKDITCPSHVCLNKSILFYSMSAEILYPIQPQDMFKFHSTGIQYHLQHDHDDTHSQVNIGYCLV